MHDLGLASNRVDRKVAFDPELAGKECITCQKLLAYGFFRRDASYRDGVRDQCLECENAPRLSTGEHVARLKESNYYSEATKKQRFQDQEEFENAAAREGRRMSAGEFIGKLIPLAPDLVFTEGRVAGDIAVYRIFGQPQPHLDGRTHEYLWYIPSGLMPEFSIWEFSELNVPIREKERGWRTPLLRLILTDMVSEHDINRVFGPALGAGSHVWHRSLHNYRNRK